MSETSHLLNVNNGGEILPRCVLFSFGVGALAASLLNEVPAFFLNPFLISLVGLKPLAAGLLMFFGKIFDAVSDPFVGSLTDKTRTRFGRRRPWILITGPIAAIANILMWQFWSIESYSWEIVYYLFAYIFLCLSLTCIFIPYSALTMEVTTDDVQRVRLTQYRMSFMFIGMIVGVGVMGCTLSFLEEKLAYEIGSTIISCLVILSTTICFLGVKEIDYENVSKEKQEIRFWRGLGLIKKNTNYMFLVGSSVFGWVSTAIVQNNLIFYCEYSLNLKEYFAIAIMVVLVGTILLIPLWTIIMNKIGKKYSFYIALFSLILLYIALIFAPKENLIYLIFCSLLAPIGLSAIHLLPWSMLPDVIDIDEIRNGERREGLFCAVFVFFNKMSLGMSLALSGIVLHFGGYKPGDEEQPESIDHILRLLIGIIPGGFTLISFCFLFFYSLTSQEQLNNSRKLRDLRAERAQEQSSSTLQ